MFSKVYSAAVHGIKAHIVEVEADVTAGIPSFDLTGNLGSAAKESKERVKTALKNSRVKMNPSRITINLSPASIRKDGPHFDLAIAVAILCATGIVSEESVKDIVFAGELGLDGKVNPVKAVLPITVCAAENGMSTVFIPKDNAREAAYVEGIRVVGVESLGDCVDMLRANRPIEAFEAKEGIIDRPQRKMPDFGVIKGQKALKRAAMVAAASMHNFLMIGPPGAGKTMTAERIPYILPDMNMTQCTKVSKIYSVAGLLKNGQDFIFDRPFRHPHHTITLSAMAGGGFNPIPGEISLAHHGVLFLDELNLFAGPVIETLRQPLESGHISVNRLGGIYDYPADFMLVAAVNPCKCGYYPDRTRCSCTEADIKTHFGRISRAIRDRIDICIQVPRVEFEDIKDKDDEEYSSAFMKSKIERAFAIQKERYSKENFELNSRMPSDKVEEYCHMERDAYDMLKRVYEKYDISARGYYKILKTARTIADIDEAESIGYEHVCEAIGYRMV